MRARLSRGVLKAVGAAAAAVCGVFLLIALAIRSDFVQRGCNYIPSNEWIYTANCTDAYNIGMFAGGVAVFGLIALTWTLWRLRDV